MFTNVQNGIMHSLMSSNLVWNTNGMANNVKACDRYRLTSFDNCQNVQTCGHNHIFWNKTRWQSDGNSVSTNMFVYHKVMNIYRVLHLCCYMRGDLEESWIGIEENICFIPFYNLFSHYVDSVNIVKYNSIFQ